MSDSSIRRSLTSSITPSLASSLTVRPIARRDAAAVAELSSQLGYEVSTEAIDKHITEVSSCPERQIAFVACLETEAGAEIVGWIEAVILRELQSPPCCFISGLVVREERRSLGIGKRLCAEVERWSTEKGISTLRVTSRMSREGAHRFYLREGFRQIKIWAVFEKILSTQTAPPGREDGI
jgi:GNAT superfamily N-acetyltransferase